MFLSFEVHKLWTNCFRPTKLIALSSARIKSNLKTHKPKNSSTQKLESHWLNSLNAITP